LLGYRLKPAPPWVPPPQALVYHRPGPPRRPAPTPGGQMQGEEDLRQISFLSRPANDDPAPLREADVPPSALRKTVADGVDAFGELEPVDDCARIHSLRAVKMSPQLDPGDAEPLTRTIELRGKARPALRRDEWVDHVRERQRYETARLPGKARRHEHRNAGVHGAVGTDLSEHLSREPVRPGQQPCPGRIVERRRIPMSGDERSPPWVVEREQLQRSSIGRVRTMHDLNRRRQVATHR